MRVRAVCRGGECGEGRGRGGVSGVGCLSKSIRQRSISSSGRCLNRSGIALHATGDCARSPIAAVLCLLLNCDTYPHTHPHNCGVRARLAAHLWRSWSLRAHARDHATSRPGLLSQRRTVRRSERRCGRDGKSGSGLSTRESGLRRAACDEVVRIRLDSWREACTGQNEAGTHACRRSTRRCALRQGARNCGGRQTGHSVAPFRFRAVGYSVACASATWVLRNHDRKLRRCSSHCASSMASFALGCPSPWRLACRLAAQMAPEPHRTVQRDPRPSGVELN